MSMTPITLANLTRALNNLKNYFVQIKDAVRTVNNTLPDSNGNIDLPTVPFSQNLESEANQRNDAAFTIRTAGGESSVKDGEAWLLKVMGANFHYGYSAHVITHEETEVGTHHLTVSIEDDDFIAQVEESGIYAFTYSSGWTLNGTAVTITDYGITVTGDPVDGDIITVSYTAEEPGTITVANPLKMIATGWNLYDHTATYARVVRYANNYRIDGAYTNLQFSATPSGSKTSISVTDNLFDPFSGISESITDGYVWVTGGNSTTTAIYLTWEDWTEGTTETFSAYSESEVDLSTVMGTYFPNGLLKAGSVVDEIDLNLKTAISRVERMQNNSTNMADAKASGREYEYDENYIYLARTAADIEENTHSIEISNGYAVDDHGLEFFTNTSVSPAAQLIYGVNLKNKLERDVLTISQQTLTAPQIQQVHSNIGIVYSANQPSNPVEGMIWLKPEE